MTQVGCEYYRFYPLLMCDLQHPYGFVYCFCSIINTVEHMAMYIYQF